jgi:glutamine amidotransferase-like uncharacterized protein
MTERKGATLFAIVVLLAALVIFVYIHFRGQSSGGDSDKPLLEIASTPGNLLVISSDGKFTDSKVNIDTIIQIINSIIDDKKLSNTSTYSSNKIDTTYMKKVTNATPGALVMTDENGDLKSTNVTIPFITECCDKIGAIIDDVNPSAAKLFSSEKVNSSFVHKPDSFPSGALATYDGTLKPVSLPRDQILATNTSGQFVDSGFALGDLIACCKSNIDDTRASATTAYSSSKSDATYQKKTQAPPNSLLMPDDRGNLVDSGITPAFLQTCCAVSSNALVKSDVQDTGTSTSKLYSSSKIDATYAKKSTAPANSLLMNDANGNLVDSGYTTSFIQSCCAQASTGSANGLMKTDIVDYSTATDKLYSSSKIDATYQKKTTAPANSLLMPDGSGNLVDSGLTPTFINACCTNSANALKKADIVDQSVATDKLYSSSKIDTTYAKKSSAPANTLLMNDASGNLVDSGLTPTYIQACCAQAATGSTNGLLKSDIVDTSTATNKLYSSSKIDATYQKKTTASANALLMPDASGNLVDSGLTPTFINTCCTNAANALKQADIVDTSTATNKLYSSSKIDATFQKKTTAPVGALLMPDANGNLVDSGITPTYIQSCCAQASTTNVNGLLKSDIVDTSTATNKLYSSSKIDATYQKKTTAPANALLVPDASGNLVDSGLTVSSVQTCCTNANSLVSNALFKADIVDTSVSTAKLYSSSKIDATYAKKSSAPANALLMNDANGNLVDSGITPTYIQSCCAQASSGNVNGLLKSDIVDTSVATDKLYSSKKIDDTYTKKSTAAANSILMNDTNGNLVTSGFTATSLQTCCTNASTALANVNNCLLKTDIDDLAKSTTKLYSSSKIDATYLKKTTAPANALLMPDANGNLVDSGLTPTFINACCSSVSGALKLEDIVDTLPSTSKLYSSSKIDATYQKKTTAPANALLMPDANGNLVDSGFTATSLQTCCTNATNAQKLVSPVTAGDLATFNSSGQVIDSGVKISDTSAPAANVLYSSAKMNTDFTNTVPTIWSSIANGQTSFTQTYTKVMYTNHSVKINSLGKWNNGNFTAPRTGIYLVSASMGCVGSGGWLIIYKNNDFVNNRWAEVYGLNTVSVSRNVPCKEGDYISIGFRVEIVGDYIQQTSWSWLDICYLTGYESLDVPGVES